MLFYFVLCQASLFQKSDHYCYAWNLVMGLPPSWSVLDACFILLFVAFCLYVFMTASCPTHHSTRDHKFKGVWQSLGRRSCNGGLFAFLENWCQDCAKNEAIRACVHWRGNQRLCDGALSALRDSQLLRQFVYLWLRFIWWLHQFISGFSFSLLICLAFKCLHALTVRAKSNVTGKMWLLCWGAVSLSRLGSVWQGVLHAPKLHLSESTKWNAVWIVENLKQSQEEASLQPQMSQICCSENEGCDQGAPMVGRTGAWWQGQQGWLCRARQQPTGHKTAAGFASASHLASAGQPLAQGNSTLFLFLQPELQASAASPLNLPHVGWKKTLYPESLLLQGPAGDRSSEQWGCTCLFWLCLRWGPSALTFLGDIWAWKLQQVPCSLVQLFYRCSSPKIL